MLKKFCLASLFALAAAFQTRAAPVEGKGTFYTHIQSDPTTLNPITSTDAYASSIQGYVFDSLLTRDDDTYKWVPCLAEKWSISKDGTTFTFTLRDGIKWHDGKPLTSEDVKYSFDVFFEGRFKAPHVQAYLQNIKEVRIVDAKTVQFITKDVYFKNFDVAAGLTVIPKHFYGSGDPDDPKFNKQLIGTGPYIFSEWAKGQKIILKRNPEFWGNQDPYFSKHYHFKRIFFRPVKEEAVALELLKKGDIDFLGLTPEQYVQKTKGPEWGVKAIAVKTQNSAPQNYSYGFIGWNQKHPFFKDRDVRIAMSHLVNRDFMIDKFLFGLSEKAVGPFGNKSPSSSPNVTPIPYNPKRALALLEKNGWKMGPSGLTKVIDGKPTAFEFTLLNANQDAEKYFTVIKEDMKKIGIKMNLKLVEWNSFVKLMDERKFDSVALAWQVNSIENDPKQIFHSESIPAPGHNFVSYSNPELDKLIEQVRHTMSETKRRPIFHKIHELIAADQPYSLLFNRKFSLYAHTAKIKKTKDTFKYSIGVTTWRTDQD